MADSETAVDYPSSGHPSPPPSLSGHGMEVALTAGALAIGLFWTVGAVGNHNLRPELFLLLVVGVLIGTALWKGHHYAPWATLLYVAVIGVVNRVGRTAFNGSDVVGVTEEAIRVVEHGGNPYLHTYIWSNPRGSPFPYLPGEIAFYAVPNALTGQTVGTDKWAGIALVLLLGSLAFFTGPAPAALGTAMYATFEAAVQRSLDGSNDTALGLLVVLAIVLLAASERLDRRFLFFASAVVFAWALLFKEFAWLLYPFVVAYLWRRGANWRGYLVVSLAVFFLGTLPFLLTAPGGFIHNIAMGLSFHQTASGLNIWVAAGGLPIAHTVMKLAPVLVVTAVVLLTVVFLKHAARTLGFALLQGLCVLVAALALTRYATSSYYTFACAVFAAALILQLGTTHREEDSPRLPDGRFVETHADTIATP